MSNGGFGGMHTRKLLKALAIAPAALWITARARQLHGHFL